MSRTYWKELPDRSLEFLGVFRDGHTPGKKTPQAEGRIIDISDRDVGQVEALLRLSEREAGPPLLVSLPSSITKKYQQGPAVLPWAQIEGYIK